ncbi:MAG: hypothetical protein HY298_01950 [Verrucomicrobia bacterium]|nr:hypothetical protein [Verrucomicrobiota bacterium]
MKKENEKAESRKQKTEMIAAFNFPDVSTSPREGQAAWRLFTPCTVMRSLLEAVNRAPTAEVGVPGEVVLVSAACSSFDSPRGVIEQARWRLNGLTTKRGEVRNHQHRGDVFRQAVNPDSESAVTHAGLRPVACAPEGNDNKSPARVGTNRTDNVEE